MAVADVTVSYAEIASKGPKQDPVDAAAPQPPQVTASETASTSSLVDVDAPSVRTVPSDFADQDVQTATQAQRLDLESSLRAAQNARDNSGKKRGAKTGPSSVSSSASDKARRLDSWVTGHLAALSDGASRALVAGNALAVLGLGGWLGYRVWGLHGRGRLGWEDLGAALGLLGAVGAVEGVFASYLRKAKGKKQ